MGDAEINSTLNGYTPGGPDDEVAKAHQYIRESSAAVGTPIREPLDTPPDGMFTADQFARWYDDTAQRRAAMVDADVNPFLGLEAAEDDPTDTHGALQMSLDFEARQRERAAASRRDRRRQRWASVTSKLAPLAQQVHQDWLWVRMVIDHARRRFKHL